MLNIVTEQEVAKIFKLSVPKLKRDRANKTGLPFFRIGKRSIRYNLEQVLKHLEENRKP